MSMLDTETKRKLREMNASELLEAIDGQDATLTISLPFEERVRLAVDDAYAAFTHAKVSGLIRRAGLRYPNADLRRLDLLEERGLDRHLLAQLGSCSFVARVAPRRARASSDHRLAVGTLAVAGAGAGRQEEDA